MSQAATTNLPTHATLPKIKLSSNKQVMKCSVSLLNVVILLAFMSCKKEPAPLNENQIPINKCQAFNRDGKLLTCCLEAVIEDSRCPIDVVCFWQGIAVARFAVSTQNTDHIITLATTKFPPYNSDTTIAGFKIEFISLSPERILNKPIKYNEYVAEVKITKP